MAEPTPKSPKIESLLKALTGKDRVETIRADKCMGCDGEAKEFRDEVSRREYSISGLCQSCQDSVFKEVPNVGRGE